jgi:chromatin segregation and condensation protein Rec8/ScpA/Scc1 (kleisin family)
MLNNLKERLKITKTFNVSDFFAQARSRRELVLAFIAVLEIVRTDAVKLFQEDVFGEIILKKI